MKTDLLIMAAGMGSRFGGLKQIEPIGPNGEIILDFSVYDAVQAGFDKAVIVIKKAIEKEFREACGKRIEKLIDVEYVFQELDCLPAGYEVPLERQKPWGTGHAVLCAKEAIHEPFAVINADDFYGAGSYRMIHDWLVSNSEACMVGYRLGNTLTENGTVSRGICEIKDGYLTRVTEHTALDRSCGLPMDTTVSMNMWGLHPDFFAYLDKEFRLFLDNSRTVPKSEFYLPSAVSKRIEEEHRKVRVLQSEELWYGVTYREDMPKVRQAMAQVLEKRNSL